MDISINHHSIYHTYYTVHKTVYCYSCIGANSKCPFAFQYQSLVIPSCISHQLGPDLSLLTVKVRIPKHPWFFLGGKMYITYNIRSIQDLYKIYVGHSFWRARFLERFRSKDLRSLWELPTYAANSCWKLKLTQLLNILSIKDVCHPLERNNAYIKELDRKENGNESGVSRQSPVTPFCVAPHPKCASTEKQCKSTQKEIKPLSLLNSCQDVASDFH